MSQLGSFAEMRAYREREDRADGAIVGLATADALGSTVEFRTPEQIRERFGPGGRTEMRGGGMFRWGVGEYTDDGQMMMCLLRSLAAGAAAHRPGQRVGLDVDDLGRRFVA